jgi:hypothetical protein
MCLCCSLKNLEKKKNRGRKGEINGGQEGVLEEFVAPISTIGDGT